MAETATVLMCTLLRVGGGMQALDTAAAPTLRTCCTPPPSPHPETSTSLAFESEQLFVSVCCLKIQHVRLLTFWNEMANM